jgi:hypothetical protein
MNNFLAFVLAAAGLTVLIWNKSISTRWRVFHTNQLNRGYSRLAHFFGWDNPDRPFAVFLFRSLTILLGLFPLIMAIHFFFGPIYMGPTHAG